jgi:hypothetical protein
MLPSAWSMLWYEVGFDADSVRFRCWLGTDSTWVVKKIGIVALAPIKMNKSSTYSDDAGE